MNSCAVEIEEGKCPTIPGRTSFEGAQPRRSLFPWVRASGRSGAVTIEVRSTPRFEFRSFGRNLDAVAARFATLSGSVPEERESEETYIISRTVDSHNVKIRAGALDIKTLVQTAEALEQWNPVMKAAFPIGADVLRGEVFPALGVQALTLDRTAYTADEFLALVDSNPELRVVHVHKHRFGYRVNGTICEVGHVFVDGTRVVTVSAEATEVEAVKKTLADVGLSGVENINYIQAIKRIIGMVDAPLAN